MDVLSMDYYAIDECPNIGLHGFLRDFADIYLTPLTLLFYLLFVPGRVAGSISPNTTQAYSSM